MTEALVAEAVVFPLALNSASPYDPRMIRFGRFVVAVTSAGAMLAMSTPRATGASAAGSSARLAGTIELQNTWSAGPSNGDHTLSGLCKTTLTFDGSTQVREDSVFDWSETIINTTQSTSRTTRIERHGSVSTGYPGSARAAYSGVPGTASATYRISHPKRGGTIPTTETIDATTVVNGRTLKPSHNSHTYRENCWNQFTPTLLGTGAMLRGSATNRSNGFRTLEATVTWDLEDCSAPAPAPSSAGRMAVTVAPLLKCGADKLLVVVEHCDPLPAGGVNWDPWFKDLYTRLGRAWQAKARGLGLPPTAGYGLSATIAVDRATRKVVITSLNPPPDDADARGQAMATALKGAADSVTTLPFPAASKITSGISYDALPSFVVTTTNAIPQPTRHFVEKDGRLCYAER